jgi:hypothetical protein
MERLRTSLSYIGWPGLVITTLQMCLIDSFWMACKYELLRGGDR